MSAAPGADPAAPAATEPSHYSNEPELIRPVETQPVLAQPWHQQRIFTQLLHWSWLVSGRLGEWEE